jgi:hypothetical protein
MSTKSTGIQFLRCKEEPDLSIPLFLQTPRNFCTTSKLEVLTLRLRTRDEPGPIFHGRYRYRSEQARPTRIGRSTDNRLFERRPAGLESIPAPDQSVTGIGSIAVRGVSRAAEPPLPPIWTQTSISNRSFIIPSPSVMVLHPCKKFLAAQLLL